MLGLRTLRQGWVVLVEAKEAPDPSTNEDGDMTKLVVSLAPYDNIPHLWNASRGVGNLNELLLEVRIRLEVSPEVSRTNHPPRLFEAKYLFEIHPKQIHTLATIVTIVITFPT